MYSIFQKEVKDQCHEINWNTSGEVSVIEKKCMIILAPSSYRDVSVSVGWSTK